MIQSLAVCLVLCVRGLLLWFVVPVAALVWLVRLPWIGLARIIGLQRRLSLRYHLQWGVQLLDAAVAKVWPDNPVGSPEWPWVVPPGPEAESVLALI